jgi:peptidoglycan biosynthesis protein MviN/MurJ (putative lipid II flippase)
VALATSIVALVNLFALAIVMRKRIKRLNGRDILRSFLKIAAASAIMSGVCFASYRLLLERFGTTGLGVRAAEAFVPIVLGGVFFAVAAKMFRVHELEMAFAMVKRKLGR